MKTGFSLCGKLHRENPVLALYWPCRGLQCSLVGKKGLFTVVIARSLCAFESANKILCVFRPFGIQECFSFKADFCCPLLFVAFIPHLYLQALNVFCWVMQLLNIHQLSNSILWQTLETLIFPQKLLSKWQFWTLWSHQKVYKTSFWGS